MTSEAVRHFKKGDIVIFPTDTLYGIGCVLSNEKSIEKLYALRKTPLSKPTPILTASLDQASLYGKFDRTAASIAKTFWPGALTIVVKARKTVPEIIQGETGTIGIRVPKFTWLGNLIQSVGEPIVASSANLHGRSTPISFAQIDRKLLSLVDYAIDLANLDDFLPMLKKPSTVVDLTKIPYQIVRVGALSEDKIKNMLGGSRK